MRILLSYSTAPDKGEGRFYREVLTRMGHEVHVIDVPGSPLSLGWKAAVTTGFAADISFADLAALFGPPDLFLYVEPDGLIPRDIGTTAFPTACVISDTHRRLTPRLRLAQFFDHVFLYQRNYLPHFTAHPPGRVSWYPYACDPQFFRDQGGERNLDVAFVGQLGAPGGERARSLAVLRQRWTLNPPGQYTQREMADLYARARIVVNFPVGDDLNFRFFEALSCGALLVTKQMDNGQDLLFREGEHFISFTDEEDLLTKIAYYLEHEEARQRIAAAGHRECLRAHTLEIRLGDLLRKVAAGGANGAPIRALSPRQQLAAWAFFTARQGRIDALWRVANMPRTPFGGKLTLLFCLAGGLLRVFIILLRNLF